MQKLINPAQISRPLIAFGTGEYSLPTFPPRVLATALPERLLGRAGDYLGIHQMWTTGSSAGPFEAATELHAVREPEVTAVLRQYPPLLDLGLPFQRPYPHPAAEPAVHVSPPKVVEQRPPVGALVHGEPAQRIPAANAQAAALSWRVSQAIYDALLGRRQLAVVRRWVAPTLFRRLQVWRRAAAPRRSSLPCRAVSVRQFSPRESVVEATVVLDDAGFLRPAALRLETYRDKWRVTAFECRL